MMKKIKIDNLLIDNNSRLCNHQKDINIVSLLSCATKIIFDLVLDDSLKGVPHACAYSIEALNKPKAINSLINVNMLESIKNDKKIKELVKKIKPIFTLKTEKTKETDLYLIINQNIC